MTLDVLTPPGGEVLGADDTSLRQHLRLMDDETDQDVAIADYAAAARQWAENYTRRYFLEQTLRLTCDGFPSGFLSLQTGPVQSITKVDYQDAIGSWVTLDPSGYRLVASSQPNCLAPAYGASWPTTRDDVATVQVDFVVGYGAAAGALPPAIVQAIRGLTAHYFRFREGGAAPESVEDVPRSVTGLLDRYRIWV